MIARGFRTITALERGLGIVSLALLAAAVTAAPVQLGIVRLIFEIEVLPVAALLGILLARGLAARTALAALHRRAAETDRTALGRLLALRGLAAALARAGDADGAARALREIAEGAGGLTGLATEATAALSGGPRCFAGDGDYPEPVPVSPATLPPRSDPVAPTSLSLGVGPEGLSLSLARVSPASLFRVRAPSALARAIGALVAGRTAAVASICVGALAVDLLLAFGAPSLLGVVFKLVMLSCAAFLVAGRIALALTTRRCGRMAICSCDPAAMLAATEGIGLAGWRALSFPGVQSFRAVALAWAGRRDEAERALSEMQDMRAALCPLGRMLDYAVSEVSPADTLNDARSMSMAIDSIRALLDRHPGSAASMKDACRLLGSYSRAAGAERIGTVEARLARVRFKLAGGRLCPLQEVTLRRAEALLLDELSGGLDGVGEDATGRPDAAALRAEALRSWRLVAVRGGTTPWAAEARARLAAPSAAAAGLAPYRRPILLEVGL